MGDLLGLVFPFFGLIFLGYFCQRLVKMPAEGLIGLSFFIIYLALPALFYRIVAQTPVEELANLRFIAVAALSTGACFALAFVIGLLCRRGNIGEAAIAAMAGSASNVGYMGPGLTLAVLGPAATSPAALVFACDSVIFFTVVPLLMALRGRGERVGPLLLRIVRQVLTHPFNMAMMLGLAAALTRFHEPEPLSRMLDYLKNAAAPCALFTLGASVAMRPLKQVPTELAPLLTLKLLLHPLIALVALSLVGGIPPVWAETLLLMTALPPALNVFILARQYDTYIEEASAAVLVGTIASVVTLTTMLYLVREGLVPLSLF